MHFQESLDMLHFNLFPALKDAKPLRFCTNVVRVLLLFLLTIQLQYPKIKHYKAFYPDARKPISLEQ